MCAGAEGVAAALDERKRGGVTHERTDLERRRGAGSGRLPQSSFGCCDESLVRRRGANSKEVGGEVRATD